MNSFMDMFVAREMEDLGHNVVRTEMSSDVKDCCIEYVFYKCKRCENIFAVDNSNDIYLFSEYLDGVGAFFQDYICKPVHGPMEHKTPEPARCDDLIIKDIIK